MMFGTALNPSLFIEPYEPLTLDIKYIPENDTTLARYMVIIAARVWLKHGDTMSDPGPLGWFPLRFCADRSDAERVIRTALAGEISPAEIESYRLA